MLKAKKSYKKVNPKLGMSEIKVLTSLHNNNFIVGNAALDLGITLMRVSNRISTLINKLPDNFFLTDEYHKDAVGVNHYIPGRRRRVCGLSELGIKYINNFISIEKNYDIIEKLLIKREECLET